MLKVFLADNSDLVRRRLAVLLGALPGVAVVGEAEDFDTALRGVRASGADVAIVDFRLAGSAGMTIVESLARGSPPVLTMVLSNHSGPQFRLACHEAGARYFFDKTSEYELARETIERLARKRHTGSSQYEPA
jgi:two-component system response regulator DevR